MEIDIQVRWHPGTIGNPRPSMRVTAKAHRWSRPSEPEWFIHTRLVDAPYPGSWAEGMRYVIEWFGRVQWQRDDHWFELCEQDPATAAEVLVG